MNGSPLLLKQKIRRRSRAFTLIEVILAVAILALLGGAVASILQGSVASATALTEISNRQSQIQCFIQLLNQTFRNLGSETLFIAQKNPIVDQNNLFLMFNNSHQLFVWHRDQSKFPAKVLTSWPSEKGALSIGILEYNRYFKLTNSTESQFSATGWVHKIALLNDVKSLSWRFWNQATRKWTEDWRNPTQRPHGIELTLELAESKTPRIHFFWIPPIQIQPSSFQNLPTTPLAPNTQNNPTPSSPPSPSSPTEPP